MSETTDKTLTEFERCAIPFCCDGSTYLTKRLESTAGSVKWRKLVVLSGAAPNFRVATNLALKNSQFPSTNARILS